MTDELKKCECEHCTKKLMVKGEENKPLAIFTIEVPFDYCCEDNNPEVWGELIQKIVEKKLAEIREELDVSANLDTKMCDFYKNKTIIPQ